MNFAVSKVNQREWSAGGTWQVRIQLQSHAVEDRRQHITWLYGPISRYTADWITCANRLATFHAATSKTDGKALRPVVAAASRIHFRRSSELGQVAHHGILQEPALMQIFDQSRIALVVHRSHNIAHAFDGCEWLGAMDVPGDLIEHGQE